jgi:hypothetical protein
MFKVAGFLCQVVDERSLIHKDGTVEKIETPYVVEYVETPPPGPLVVWRGASLKSRGRGFSWTQYRDCAQENFAQAWADLYQSPSGLYRAEIPGRAVLAIFGDDREQEVVVNPNMLRGRVELVSTVEPEPRQPHPVFGTLGLG